MQCGFYHVMTMIAHYLIILYVSQDGFPYISFFKND